MAFKFYQSIYLNKDASSLNDLLTNDVKIRINSVETLDILGKEEVSKFLKFNEKNNFHVDDFSLNVQGKKDTVTADFHLIDKDNKLIYQFRSTIDGITKNNKITELTITDVILVDSESDSSMSCES